MNDIKIITASAGSGKTTRLTQVLEQALSLEQVRPHAIVATTFTNKAAAELQERARQRLLEAGRTAEAHQLGAARIGTVNSVCGRLVEELAFDLGLPPEIQVIDEHVAADTLNRSLSRAITEDVERKLAELKSRLVDFDWQDAVRRVIESARSNGIRARDLDASATQSIETLLGLFGKPVEDGSEIDARLVDALKQFLDAYDSAPDGTKKSREAADKCRQALARLERGEPIAWHEWARLAALDVAKRSSTIAQCVLDAAVDHDRHPQLHDDLRQAVGMTFALAGRALAAYQDLKRHWGVVDFVDQEVYALKLLRREDVRQRLADEIDLVLVDEFQDTSPLQLAIFLELAKIAKQSVWVGDQKQAIFGFRGTDPALMAAALEDLLEGTDPVLVDNTVDKILGSSRPETLSKSYRSRPELVRLTSELFARAFAKHGIPEERVRLEPGLEDVPEGLGPIVEHWRLRIPNNNRTTLLAPALAAGVRDLLRDETQRVRDAATDEARRLCPGDVAVLCRTNDECARVAVALESLGVRAEVPRIGLLGTAEAVVALAGLTLWIDPRDRLSAAKLARLTGFPEDGDAWLAEVLEDPTSSGLFDDVPAVEAVRAAREAAPQAGALEALDRVIDATGLRELCRRWGEEAMRVANLDALRSHAVSYVQGAESRNLPATVTGLLRELRELGREYFTGRKTVPAQDRQALRTAGDAVVVSTWHRAKGLEWPVTVLFGLERSWPRNALGVQVATDWGSFDINRPLDGRWVRFWPTPFRGPQKGSLFRDRLLEHPENRLAMEQDRREQLRLLYVGWTRARDRLVLASHEGRLLKGRLSQITDVDSTLIRVPIEAPPILGRENPVTAGLRTASPAEPEPRSPEPGSMTVATGSREHPPAVLVPSSIEGSAAVAEPEIIGERMVVRGDPDMAHLGEAVHGFLAADDPELGAEDRRTLAAGLLERWQVAGTVEVDALLAASTAMRAWLGKCWPGASSRHEVPVRHRLESGTIVRGTVDLVVDAADATAIVDHKTFPGSPEDARQRASAFAGQLGAYRDAVEAATGKTVESTWIHLPVLGHVIRIAT